MLEEYFESDRQVGRVTRVAAWEPWRGRGGARGPGPGPGSRPEGRVLTVPFLVDCTGQTNKTLTAFAPSTISPVNGDGDVLNDFIYLLIKSLHDFTV